jgi:hypothetical protein
MNACHFGTYAPVTHSARFPGHHWCSLDWLTIAVGWGTVRLACPRSHRRSRDHRMLCCEAVAVIPFPVSG